MEPCYTKLQPIHFFLTRISAKALEVMIIAARSCTITDFYNSYVAEGLLIGEYYAVQLEDSIMMHSDFIFENYKE